MGKKGEYIEMPDFKELAFKLAAKFPDKYGNIPLEKIKFYAVVNKEKNNAKSKIYNIMSVPEPLANDINLDIVMFVYLSNWSSLEDKNRALVVLSALSSLEFDGDRIRMKGYDVNDHREIVELFGLDYENSPDVPDILGLEKK